MIQKLDILRNSAHEGETLYKTTTVNISRMLWYRSLIFFEIQHMKEKPGNISRMSGYKVSPSCAEFRRISSFCITASGKYLRQCLFYRKFLHVLNFEEYQASVSQHPGNIYGSLFYIKFDPSCAEFRRISSFCITASGKYLR